MSQYRDEKDSIGNIKVHQEALWGAQTQRSLQNFKIGEEKFPCAFIHAYVELKKQQHNPTRNLEP